MFQLQKTSVTKKHIDSKLYIDTPIGKIEVMPAIEKELNELTDEELLTRALAENKAICVSPAVYAMVEKRNLQFELQKRVNPHVGFRH